MPSTLIAALAREQERQIPTYREPSRGQQRPPLRPALSILPSDQVTLDDWLVARGVKKQKEPKE